VLSLPPPARDDSADYQAFALKRPAHVCALLQGAAQVVTGAYELYGVNTANLGALAPLDLDEALKDALRANYTLMSSTGSMSELRAELMALSPYGRCAMCGVGEAATLDHYLPKTSFSEFSVFALNLVPTCDPCNRKKATKFSALPGGQFLHAYFHPLPNLPLLLADVEGIRPVVIDYRVAELGEVDPDTTARLSYQFNQLCLRDKFCRVAVGEIADRRVALRNYYGPDENPAQVRIYLQREAESTVAQLGLNHWKSALFNALAQSDQFCDGGFL
jgi:hypothetical protein